MGLPLIVGGAAAALNIGANLLSKNEFPYSDDDINKLFDERLATGRARIADASRRRLIGQGLEGSTAIATLINDFENRFAENLEQQRLESLNNIRTQRIQFENSQPSTAQIIAGGIASGAQAGLNVYGLQGGFDNFLNSFKTSRPRF